jgi:hypothetical protein
MHPGQQRRVAGLIRRSVLIHPGDPLMDPLHFGDEPLGVGGSGKVVAEINWLVRRRRPKILAKRE